MYNGDIRKKSSGSILERIFHRRKKRLLTNIELEFQKYLDVHTLFSILFIVMGVIMAIWNSIPNFVLSIGTGLYLLVFSFIQFCFFLRRRELSFYHMCVFYGIVCLILGGFVFFQENIQGVLKLLGGFYILVSIERYLESFYFLRIHDKDVVVLLVSTILLDFIAVLLFINPFSQLLGGEVLGVFFILFGIINISELSFLNKKASPFLSFFES